MKTKYSETEALLLVLEDLDVDSGFWIVDDFLRENFLPGELTKLMEASYALSDRCRKIYAEKVTK